MVLIALTLLAGSLGLLTYLILSFLGKNKDFWKQRGVSILPYDLTIKDLLTAKRSPPDLDLDSYQRLVENDEKFGGTVEFGTPLLLIRDLHLVKQIMVKDFDHFTDHRRFIDTDPLFSKALFFLHGQEWKDMRGILSPTFTSGKIKRMFHHFQNSGKKLLDFIEREHTMVDGNGYDIFVSDVMSRFTIDVIGAVAFGMETGALSSSTKDSQFCLMAREATNILSTKRLIKLGVFNFWPMIGNFFKMEILEKDCSDYFQGLLRTALRDRVKSGEKRDDFLQLLLEAMNSESGNNMKEDVAVQQAFVFFMAGFDTIANLLGEAAYLLALSPDVQDKLFEEVSQFMEESNGNMNYESVNSMEYLEMVISEVLRMYPPVERLERRCVKTYKIPDTEIVLPVGTMIAVPAGAIHHDERYYENPREFNPERFSAENKASRNPYSYMPFGQGPRNCIGMRLALIEAKVALSTIIYNFNIQPIQDKTPIPIQLSRPFGFTRVPTTLQLRMVPRAH